MGKNKKKQEDKKTKKKEKREPRIFTVESFEVRKSKIKGIGLGLFAKEKIRKGDTIGFYTGKILTDKDTEEEPYLSSKYLLWICKDHWIYGEGKLANYTRYINHSNEPNAELVTSTRWKTARFKALQKIKSGEEIFFDYGEEYWDALEFKPV